MNKHDIERAIEDVLDLRDRYTYIQGTRAASCDTALALLRAELARPESWILTSEQMPPSTRHTVLVYYKNENGLGRRVRAEWVKSKTVESSTDSDIGEYDDETDTYYDPQGWYEKIDNWPEYTSVFISHEVTHWTALPEAPV